MTFTCLFGVLSKGQFANLGRTEASHLPSTSVWIRDRSLGHTRREALQPPKLYTYKHTVSLATNKCSFPKNRFQPKVVSIFHAPRRRGELLAQRAKEITGLSAGQHGSAALSFRQDKMEVKDGYGAVITEGVDGQLHCRQ